MNFSITLDAVKAHLTPALFDSAEKWLAFAINSAWVWFLLGMVAAVWILKRFVVRPLSRLLDNRPQPLELDDKLHVLTNELKYVRLAVDELRGLLSSLKEEHDAVEDMRRLADELRAIVGSLRNERDDGKELRIAMQEIRSAVSFLTNEQEEKADELRSVLTSLITEYEQARAN